MPRAASQPIRVLYHRVPFALGHDAKLEHYVPAAST